MLRLADCRSARTISELGVHEGSRGFQSHTIITVPVGNGDNWRPSISIKACSTYDLNQGLCRIDAGSFKVLDKCLLPRKRRTGDKASTLRVDVKSRV